MTAGLWDRETFVEKLRAIGERAYHDKHPFHVAMNEGRLSPEALRGWVANRFYYQRNIPIKDAAILANCQVREVRRAWIHRILDHDGVLFENVESAVLSGESEAPNALGTAHTTANEGGIEAWLRLGEACGISRDELLDNRRLLPGVRFAVDAYVNFARNRSWPIAIASSLTELFAPDLMATRLTAFEKFYQWIDSRGLDYFRRRLTQARRDSNEALAITLEYCNTPELQRDAVRALEFKCDVLWSMLDTIHHAYGGKEERLPSRPNTRKLDSCEGVVRMGAAISDSVRPRLAKGVRLQADSTTGQSVLLYPEGVVELNETAHEILSRCDGRTLGEIVGELAEQYEADAHALTADVRETLSDLKRRKLIEFT
jgi:pyrroloquinoline-quinone synthase